MNLNNAYESNELIDRLPKHLKQFIKPQNYTDYSPINQAVWRYVMRKNVKYLAEVAHPSYVKGLNKTGIGTEEIPSLYGMNRILKEIGWAAVAVDGFIPPNAFMEFQANKVLVIASDIRQLENIEYTPSPDIIHEAAGHAPIIANPDYSEFLRRLGDIGSKAILSQHDIDLYEAVRKLSILKEAESSTQVEIEMASKAVEELQLKKVAFSEMAKIRNLQWWSVEYGLIGDMDAPKIYGAGLLSSIGESKSCMTAAVKKIPFSIQVTEQDFDITSPQPLLYVTPDFSYLMEVLEQFANSLSLRKGGVKGLQQLIASQMVGTIELNTGLQISGKFTQSIVNDDKEVIFFKTEGPTALAYREKELIGHGIEYHQEGFSSPLGKLKNINLAIEDMGPFDLKAYNFYDNEWLSFEFESGIKVKGLNITGIRNIRGKLMLIQLTECTVTNGDQILFKPEYGTFDMAIGSDIISAYAGAADHDSFPNLYAASKMQTIQPVKSATQLKIEDQYAKVRQIRNESRTETKQIAQIFELVAQDFPQEWLLQLELLELANDKDLKKKIRNSLTAITAQKPGLTQLIMEGMALLEVNA
ncbi:aromatic amino acid hydroxylase [Putridiphycobacter roseus]|uniref:Aromatic amino acid hydroxylase n=1 Tax=Putridiphycobacter roseus TaxID=2219161 RepID=A0A2W1MV21_9FLAO|nr:aromatic amino acid hydroxylase [Putridiphycobacter roseus]PZE15929.1 aromatic amino acid hydroxylase [Putridiphycobacter roseus]